MKIFFYTFIMGSILLSFQEGKASLESQADINLEPTREEKAAALSKAVNERVEAIYHPQLKKPSSIVTKDNPGIEQLFPLSAHVEHFISETEMGYTFEALKEDSLRDIKYSPILYTSSFNPPHQTGVFKHKYSSVFYNVSPYPQERRTGIFNQVYDLKYDTETQILQLNAKLWQGESEEKASTLLYFQQQAFLKEALQSPECHLTLNYEFESKTQHLKSILAGSLPKFRTQWDLSFKSDVFLPSLPTPIKIREKEQVTMDVGLESAHKCPFSDKCPYHLDLKLVEDTHKEMATHNTEFRREDGNWKKEFFGNGTQMMPIIAADGLQLLALAGRLSAWTLSEVFPVNLWIAGKYSLTKEEIKAEAERSLNNLMVATHILQLQDKSNLYVTLKDFIGN